MKFPALLFLLSFAVFLNAQPAIVNDTLNQTDSLGKRTGYWKITAAMLKRTGFPSPQSIVEEGTYVDGRKTGLWIEYHPNGKMRSKLMYANNRPNGAATVYYENEHVKETGTWQGTRWIGEYKLYYENDTLRQHFFFDSMGRRNGIQRAWWSNGKLMYESPHVNGKQEGWTKEYYEDGTLKSETYYVNGYISTDSTARNYPPRKIPDPRPRPPVPPTPPPHKDFCNGYAVLYNANKQIDKKGTFKNCKLLDGEERLYDANGLLLQIRVYRDGKYVGDGVLPNEEQKIQPECTRILTEFQKKFVDSVFRSTACYAHHDSIGTARQSDGNGNIVLYKCRQKEFQGWFVNWKLMCGVQYVFDHNGMLLSVKVYEEGRFTKEILVP